MNEWFMTTGFSPPLASIDGIIAPMARITKITEQKRRPNRRNIFLDGKFAFGVNLNVVAKFRLREGQTISDEQVADIQQGELRQEVFDKALSFLEIRLHSHSELRRKLILREYGPAVIDAVLADLVRLDYVDDARFAKVKARYAAERKSQGRNRAMVELLKKGVDRTTANRALEEVYESHDSMAVARRLAEKQSARLLKLDPATARRRLTGMLLRRGFDYDAIRPVVEAVLGGRDEATQGADA